MQTKPVEYFTPKNVGIRKYDSAFLHSEWPGLLDEDYLNKKIRLDSWIETCCTSQVAPYTSISYFVIKLRNLHAQANGS